MTTKALRAESIALFYSAHVSYALTDRMINLGAANASSNRDLLTLGLGARFRATDNIDVGAAYEFPLTNEADNLMDSRITFDLVYRF